MEALGTPLYIKVKNDLLMKIREKQWLVDEQIPSEQELMDIYSVGRETVRKAVELLVREGYLYKKRGIGTFVKRNTPNLTLEPLISLSSLFQSRGYNEKSIVLKKEIIDIDDQLNKITKIPIGQKTMYIRRKRTIDGYPLALEDAYFIYNEDTVNKYNFENSITKYLLEYGHIKLSKLDQTFIKRKPTKDECNLLDINEGIDIIELERWTYMENFEDVYFYVKILILSDIYSFFG